MVELILNLRGGQNGEFGVIIPEEFSHHLPADAMALLSGQDMDFSDLEIVADDLQLLMRWSALIPQPAP